MRTAIREFVLLFGLIGGHACWAQPVSEIQHRFDFEGEDRLASVEVDGEVVRIHTQGLSVTESRFFVTGRLEKHPKRALLLSFDRVGSRKYEVLDITPPELKGELLDHPGGFDRSVDGAYWIPISTSHRKGPTKICQYHIDGRVPLSKAELRSSFVVDDHIGALCCLNDGALVGANWDTNEIYVWNTKGEEKLRVKQALTLAKGNPHVAVQDWKHFDSRMNLAIIGGLDKSAGESQAIIMVADVLRGHVHEIHRLPQLTGVARPITNEGLAVYDGKLYLLPEDIGRGAKVLRYRILRTR